MAFLGHWTFALFLAQATPEGGDGKGFLWWANMHVIFNAPSLTKTRFFNPLCKGSFLEASRLMSVRLVWCADILWLTSSVCGGLVFLPVNGLFTHFFGALPFHFERETGCDAFSKPLK